MTDMYSIRIKGLEFDELQEFKNLAQRYGKIYRSTFDDHKRPRAVSFNDVVDIFVNGEKSTSELSKALEEHPKSVIRTLNEMRTKGVVHKRMVYSGGGRLIWKLRNDWEGLQ